MRDESFNPISIHSTILSRSGYLYFNILSNVRSGEGQLPAGTPAGGVGYPHMDTITYRNVPVLPDSKIMDYLTAYITSVSSADYLFSDPVVS